MAQILLGFTLEVDPMDGKVCCRFDCPEKDQIQPFSAFGKNSRENDKRDNYCKACRRRLGKERYENNRKRNVSGFNPFDDTLKWCTGHKGNHPRTREYWNANKSMDDGLDSVCKECSNKRGQERRSKNTLKYKPLIEGYLKCLRCEKVGRDPLRPVGEFSEHRSNDRTKRDYCKLCEAEIRMEERIEVLKHYGGDPPDCELCSETELKFLSLDHIDGGGAKHRKEVGAGYNFLVWLKRNKYPPGFRVLCHCCNQCENARKKRQDLLNLVSETTKVCKKCRTERFTAQFYEDDRYDGGFRPVCRICLAEEYDDVRLECLRHYSGGDPFCACCGRTDTEVLCIDHINGRNKELRTAMKNYPQYVWIKRNNFPEGLRVLCHSCNQARQYYGKCPHEKD